MTDLYSDLEGLRLAMEIEDRGKEFYDQAVKQAKSDEHKQLFIVLRDEEVQHYCTFAKMYDVLKANNQPLDDSYLFDQETSRYITALAESHIFPKREKAAETIAKLDTVLKILRLAVQAEKDSILLYNELADHAKFPETKKVFETLRAEERGHVLKLQQMIKI